MFGLFKKIKNNYKNIGKGRILSLQEVPDEIFSKNMLGEGYAVDLIDGIVKSPIDGDVIVAFASNHAFGIKDKNGMEVLIHLGINTIRLNGEGFYSDIKQGDHVKAGDVLAKMDLEKIKSSGYSTITPVIFTSGQKIELLKHHQEADENTTEIFKFKK